MIRRHYRGMSCFPMLYTNFPIDRFIRCYPPDMKFAGTAILANRFGKRWINVKKWVTAQSRAHGLEVHFMSGPARRTNRQELFDLWQGVSVHELNKLLEADALKGLDLRIRRLKTRLEDTISDKTEVLICPELEDNLTDGAFQILLQHFKSEFSTWATKPTWVRCPCTGGSELFRCLKEVHGRSRNAAGVFNPDGVSIAFHDGEAYFDTMSINDLKNLWAIHADSRLCLLWPANFQGVGSADSFNYSSIFSRDYKVTDNAIRYCREILTTT